MFHFLGTRIVRHWKLCLSVWLILAVLANGILGGWLNSLHIFPVEIPRWNDIADTGEFAFMPKDMPSPQAEDLFRKAFPEDRLASSVVIVVRHTSSEIDEMDRTFITESLTPKLKALQREPDSVIEQVRDFNDRQVGALLNSADKKSTLIIVELRNEFLDQRNRPTIDKIQKLIDPENGELRKSKAIPHGLHLALSGPATVGRDLLVAADESAASTESWTVILVIFLLLLIYRAPVLAFIPLFSVFIAVQIAMALLLLMTWGGKSGYEMLAWIKPFLGLRTHIAVVVYGAGVDYCLFLIARYKEELDKGVSHDVALTVTMEKVGAALVASAATVMCGIGMMVFALFGKFQQAGIGLSFSLFIMLICSLTFTPALIRLAGKYAFWPQMMDGSLSRHAGWISGANMFNRIFEHYGVTRLWEIIGDLLIRRPVQVWTVCVLAMLPFAAIGFYFHGYLSYGLLSELPSSNMSVVGAKAVQEHFPAGETGPVTILIENKNADFSGDTYDLLAEFIDKLKAEKNALGLSDIRSVEDPWGVSRKAGAFVRGQARARYISEAEGYDSQVARIDLVLLDDPFSRASMEQLNLIERRLYEILPKGLQELAPILTEEELASAESVEQDQNPSTEAADANPDEKEAQAAENSETPTVPQPASDRGPKIKTKLHFLGTTASLRDLKTVTDRDQIVIDQAVLLVVLVILIALLRKVAISAYLVLSVFFSYFVSLGMTFAVFWLLVPSFEGIDWKVPIFLFTILIAVGEDYNIFLMARIEEDQKEFGPVEGIRTALQSTGSIISSCGIIMAGTFFSLVLAGSLRGSQQLGFALASGVLLDTFIVRPILVPAWLIMLNTNRLGPLSRILGGLAHEEKSSLTSKSA